MRVVVKACILSSKWRYLWLSASTLNFDDDEVVCNSLGSCKFPVECICRSWDRKRAGFTNLVERVLFFFTKCNIVNFNLISTCLWLEPAQVCSWINAGLGLKSQNVVIVITPHKPFEILAHLFTSNVEELTLSCYTEPARTRFPNAVHRAAHLKSLELNCLLFPDGNVERELILSFPILENLEISNCNVTHLKILSISAPLLERLELPQICTDKYSSCKVKMCTPNLISVKLVIHLEKSLSPVEYCMENSSPLTRADIRIRSYNSEDSADECVKCWTEVLSWTCNVQCLKLVTSSVQSLVGSPILLKRLPEIFHNLEHVTIMEDCKTSFGAVLNFLERVPRIKTLILKRKFRYREVGEKWTVNLPLQEIFTCLETFEFGNFNGSKVQMEFLGL